MAQVSKAAIRHVQRFVNAARTERDNALSHVLGAEPGEERTYCEAKSEAYSAVVEVLEREFGCYSQPEQAVAEHSEPEAGYTDEPTAGDRHEVIYAGYQRTLCLSLHTKAQRDGDQTMRECDYIGYEPQTLNHHHCRWFVADDCVSNATEIVFPVCAGRGQLITHITIGTATATAILPLSKPLFIELHEAPLFVRGTLRIPFPKWNQMVQHEPKELTADTPEMA